MESRQLGGLTTFPVGIGTLPLTRAYGAVEREEALETLRQACQVNHALIDTADFFAGGEIERLIGSVIAGRPPQVRLATCGGLRFDAAGSTSSIDGSPSYLRQACEASLRRLGVESIDLYFLAGVDPAVPIEESFGALAELVQAGKVHHLGLTADADNLRRAATVHPVSAAAFEYSLLDRTVEDELLPLVRSLGAGLVARRPLSLGLLAGRLTNLDDLPADDVRRELPQFYRYNFATSLAKVRRAEAFASRRDISVGRCALAWMLAQGLDIVPVPGTRSPTHAEMNMASPRVLLTAGEVSEISSLMAEVVD